MNIGRFKQFTDEMVVFLLLFLSVSFLVTNDIISSGLTIGLWLFTFGIILLTNKIRFNYKVLIATSLLMAAMMITYALNSYNFFVQMKVLYSIVAVCAYACVIDFEKFANLYVKVMKKLSVISLVGYFIHLAWSPFFDRFIIYNRSGGKFSNWIVYIQHPGTGFASYRNMGFTWEPGAFVTFVCLAMLLDIFVVNKHLSFKTAVLYLTTAITTFSTTGIIAVLCLCLYVIAIDHQMSKRTKGVITLALVIMLISMVMMSDIFFDRSTNSTFGKLLNYKESGNKIGYTSSVSVRVNAITKAFEAFLKKPLIGWGYEGLIRETYNYTFGMNTCTFINWFAVYGVIFGFIMLRGMYKFCGLLTKGKFKRLTLLGFMFIITISENYVHCPIIFLLIFYGYAVKRNNFSPEAKLSENSTD